MESATGKILFVDNDPDFLDTRAEFLQNTGYQVLRAYTLDQARDILADRHVHLAIIDIRMIDEDDELDVSGLVLAKDPLYRSVPKIILTGFPSYQAVREALGPTLDGLPPAVDFVAKQEGPEALIEALKQTFAQYVNIDGALSIRWGREDELLPPHMVSLVCPGLSRERLSGRAEELEDLFRKLFHGYDQLTFGRVLTRRDGLVLLTAFAYRGQAEEQFILACGQRSEILQERECYEAFVLSKMGERGFDLAKSAETIHLGVLAYRLRGATLEGIGTFSEFYRRHPADRVSAAIDDLFQVTLQPWYYKGKTKRQKSLQNFYLERLDEECKSLTQTELEEVIEGVCRAALAAGVEDLNCSHYKLTICGPEGEDFSYPNPAPYLYEERIAVSPPTLFGIAHGRLDGASVLVDRTGRTWIVDSGKAGSGPLIQDFVSLETAVKFHMLRGAGLAERHKLERRLFAAERIGETADADGLGLRAEKALRTINQIRCQAASVVGSEIEPYSVGLLFCATAYLLDYRPELRYTREETIAFAHILLFMGMVCQRLVGWEDRLRNLPPKAAAQAARSLWVDAENQEVWIEGRPVTLTPQRFQLLEYLYEHANQLCRHSDIARDVFGLDHSGLHPASRKRMEKDTITTSIRRLRGDIEPNPSYPKYIRTVRGAGYKLVLDVSSEDV